VKTESKAKLESILKFKPMMDKVTEESDTETDAEINISLRIAKESYKISQRIDDDTKGFIGVAMSLLLQAQSIVNQDSSYALKLLNRARVIARKS
jgi:hypothetical protein